MSLGPKFISTLLSEFRNQEGTTHTQFTWVVGTEMGRLSKCLTSAWTHRMCPDYRGGRPWSHPKGLCQTSSDADATSSWPRLLPQDEETLEIEVTCLLGPLLHIKQSMKPNPPDHKWTRSKQRTQPDFRVGSTSGYSGQAWIRRTLPLTTSRKDRQWRICLKVEH